MWKWKFIIRLEIFITYLSLWNMFIQICNISSFYLQFCKKKIRNICNSGEQKYISHMFVIDKYV